MCQNFDELNKCCALERMEAILQKKYRDDKPAWDIEQIEFD